MSSYYAQMLNFSQSCYLDTFELSSLNINLSCFCLLRYSFSYFLPATPSGLDRCGHHPLGSFEALFCSAAPHSSNYITHFFQRSLSVNGKLIAFPALSQLGVTRSGGPAAAPSARSAEGRSSGGGSPSSPSSSASYADTVRLLYSARDAREARMRDPRVTPVLSQELEDVRSANEHFLRIRTTARCRVPRTRVVHVKEFYSDPSKEYLPRCTILHRCGDDVGCCDSEQYQCVPRAVQEVTLHFYVSQFGACAKSTPTFPRWSFFSTCFHRNAVMLVFDNSFGIPVAIDGSFLQVVYNM
ncbi:hypothetical protein HPB48_024998 [Haemaphysalis longicornis]|uniref:Platelet-derived growth factor (PDGF) family profile domain-containing protein n=1 Tax=Haemaphysalis longicornis TaxID=44386 RepID=A0A9J6H916_HAELO|nr:hypothetical protein HPB48_024998 [Haemaphysalis longicornis]